MKARTHKQEYLSIVYDADRVRHPAEHLFDARYWQQRGALVGTAPGRGSALMLETEFGPAVLKQYLRGGWAARVSRDRYVFSGYERSRPFQEFTVLEQLSLSGMPSPEPIAAICRREGRLYTGCLLTRRIMDVSPLADLIAVRKADPAMWRATGACIRSFHEVGLVHADLNARNILVGARNQVSLVDFDRARFRSGDTRAFGANLRRLHRSLDKDWPDSFKRGLKPCWELLLAGYEVGGTKK